MSNSTTRFFGKTIWLLGVVTLGLTFLPSAFAASNDIPVCGAASLAIYDASGFACTLGVYTLDDFTFSSSQTGGATLATDSQIIVDPTGSSPTTLSVQFSTPGGFTAASGQTAEYIVQYNIDPLLPMITGGDVDLGPNDPVTLTGEFCGNGTIVSAPSTDPTVFPTCMGNDVSGIFPEKLQLMGSANGPSSVGFQFPSTVSTLDTRLILDVTGPGGADSFGSVANVTGGGPSSSSSTATPEPSATFLMAPALLGIAWLRKRLQAAK